MADYEELSTSFGVRSPIPYSWMNQIGENFANHEERIGDAETSVADHADRIDLLEGNGPSADRIYTASVVLSDKQIRELPTTSIQLVAAPGAGYRFKVVELSYDLDTTAAAYGNIDPTYASLWVGTSVTSYLASDIANDSTVPLSRLDTFLTVAHALAIDIPCPAVVTIAGAAPGDTEYTTGLISTPRSSVDNAALLVGLDNNGTGNLTGGHAFSNYLRVTVGYRILTTVSVSMSFHPGPDSLPRRQRPRRRRNISE